MDSLEAGVPFCPPLCKECTPNPFPFLLNFTGENQPFCPQVLATKVFPWPPRLGSIAMLCFFLIFILLSALVWLLLFSQTSFLILSPSPHGPVGVSKFARWSMSPLSSLRPRIGVFLTASCEEEASQHCPNKTLLCCHTNCAFFMYGSVGPTLFSLALTQTPSFSWFREAFKKFPLKLSFPPRSDARTNQNPPNTPPFSI